MLQDTLQMLQDIINWFKAAWLSFQVSQNARRLMFLRDLAGRQDKDTVTLATYRRVINHLLSAYPNLDCDIFPLAQAEFLLQHTQLLIQIGERCIYGPD